MGVAQLVELLVVVQVVAGSSPVAHPSWKPRKCGVSAFPAARRLAGQGSIRGLTLLNDATLAADQGSVWSKSSGSILKPRLRSPRHDVAGRGPGGRRFKSCFPDYAKGLQSQAFCLKRASSSAPGVEQLWNKCSCSESVTTPSRRLPNGTGSSLMGPRERVRSLRGAPGYAARMSGRGRAARSGRSRRAGTGSTARA